MIRPKVKVINKKESKFKREHLYLMLFVFLGIFFLSLIGYSGNNLTSLAPLNIGNSIGDALNIFSHVLGPFLQAIGEDQNAIFLRLFYWLFLFFIISGIEGLRKKFGSEETGAKRANIIAGIIALMAVVFTPVEFLILVGSSIFLIVVMGLIIGGLYWIYNFQRNQENRFTYFVKAFASLILFLLISAASSYASGKFSDTFGAGAVLNTALGIGLFVCILFFVWYLFIKTLMGGQTEVNETTPPSRQLREAGGFYGGLAGGAARATGRGFLGLGRLFGRGARAATDMTKDKWQNRTGFRSGGDKKLFQMLTSYSRRLQVGNDAVLNEFNSSNPNKKRISSGLNVMRGTAQDLEKQLRYISRKITGQDLKRKLDTIRSFADDLSNKVQQQAVKIIQAMNMVDVSNEDLRSVLSVVASGYKEQIVSEIRNIVNLINSL